jgi:hypothetical protein
MISRLLAKWFPTMWCVEQWMHCWQDDDISGKTETCIHCGMVSRYMYYTEKREVVKLPPGHPCEPKHKTVPYDGNMSDKFDLYHDAITNSVSEGSITIQEGSDIIAKYKVEMGIDLDLTATSTVIDPVMDRTVRHIHI